MLIGQVEWVVSDYRLLFNSNIIGGAVGNGRERIVEIRKFKKWDGGYRNLHKIEQRRRKKRTGRRRGKERRANLKKTS